jgi:hypothetical protein
MVRVVVGSAVDETEPEGTVHRTGGVEGAVHLSEGPPDRGHGIGGPAGTRLAPMGRAARRPVVRLGGPSAGPVRIQDARTLNTAPAPEDRRGRRCRLGSAMYTEEAADVAGRRRRRGARRRAPMPPPTRCDIQIDDDGSELTGDHPSSEGPKAGDDFRPAGGITTIFFFRMTSTLAHSTAAR